MDRREALALVGKRVRLFNRHGDPTMVSFTLARYDSSRRQFVTRNIHTAKESPMPAEDVRTGLADGTLRTEVH